MHYIKVVWDHDHADEPLAMYSECDEDRWETRKVEVFRDGRLEYAGGRARLARLAARPGACAELTEIARKPEFHPEEITRPEFEALWSIAIGGGRLPLVAE